MSLFTSGDNGKFDNTVDPNGNPPSDWNITKSADSIVRYTTDNPITGTGSMHCESRTIFNDDYGLNFLENGQVDFEDFNGIAYGDLPLIDYTDNFEIEFKFYPFSLPNAQEGFFNKLLDVRVNKEGVGGYLQITSYENLGTGTTSVQFQFSKGVGGFLNVVSNNDLLKNSLNTIVISFVNGSSASVTVNGNTTSISHSLDFTGYEVVRQWATGSSGSTSTDDQKNIDGVFQDIIFKSGGITHYRYKLNQEQGNTVFESISSNFQDILVNFNQSQLIFGGGAWVDTTTL